MKAVIDVGSNSVLLAVATKEGGAWRTVADETWVTGLGRGTKATGLLSERSMTETLEAVAKGFEIARSHGCKEILAAATMAARIATNQREFLDRAKAQSTPITILSGEEEAELGFEAVSNDPLFADKPVLTIVDPGGNSTELTNAQMVDGKWDIRFRKSFPVGALGLRDGTLSDESPDFMARFKASGEIDDLIGTRFRPHETGTVVALGAAACNLVSVREGFTTWQPDKVHGAWLDFEEISRAVAWMSEMTDSQRAEIPGLEPGRERTIHIGSLILERFIQAAHGLGCHASVRGWRHALLEREK